MQYSNGTINLQPVENAKCNDFYKTPPPQRAEVSVSSVETQHAELQWRRCNVRQTFREVLCTTNSNYTHYLLLNMFLALDQKAITVVVCVVF